MTDTPETGEAFTDAWKYAGWANKALDGYEYAFAKYLNSFPILEYGDFWQMQHKFSTDIIVYGLPFPLASLHLFSGPTEEEDIHYTFQDALRFVKSWHDMKAKTESLLTEQSLPTDFADSILITDSNLWEELLKGTLASSEFELGQKLDEFAEDTYENDYSKELLQFMRDSGGIGERLESAARGAFAAKVRSAHPRNKQQEADSPEQEGGFIEGGDKTDELQED